jgi:probable rRNA maturation factor
MRGSNIRGNSPHDAVKPMPLPLSHRPSLNTLEILITIDLPDSAGWDPQLESAIRDAVTTAANSRGQLSGRIGVMIADDETIHEINRRHLDHDYPTDVISFTYERSETVVDGELVASLCTARRSANELGWDWRHELLLYVVHGTLHICGLEDTTPQERAAMRAQEQAVLRQLGIDDAWQYSPDGERQALPVATDEAYSTERS